MYSVFFKLLPRNSMLSTSKDSILSFALFQPSTISLFGRLNWLSPSLIWPSNLYIALFGFSQFIIKTMLDISVLFLKILRNSFVVLFIFKLVSPSKPFVSTKQLPFVPLEFKSSKSAGINSSLLIFKISPTRTFFHAISWSYSLSRFNLIVF